MCTSRSCMSLVVNYQNTLATFRLEYKDDYKYKFTVLSTTFGLQGKRTLNLYSMPSAYSNLKVAINSWKAPL